MSDTWLELLQGTLDVLMLTGFCATVMHAEFDE